MPCSDGLVDHLIEKVGFSGKAKGLGNMYLSSTSITGIHSDEDAESFVERDHVPVELESFHVLDDRLLDGQDLLSDNAQHLPGAVGGSSGVREGK